MNAIKMDGWALIHGLTGLPVLEGEILEDFRGDQACITGGRPPHKPSSTGRLWTAAGGEFFPSVFGCKWVIEKTETVNQ